MIELSESQTSSSSATGSEIVPMLSQQNQALQDMVKNYQNEIASLREFSNEEKLIYEQQIFDLQNELKENRKECSSNSCHPVLSSADAMSTVMNSKN